MSELNESQRKLAETLDGMIVVDAGPGTGKTHTITERYLNMLRKDIDPMDILMLTFTNNSAKEMKDRIVNAMMSDDGIDEEKKSRIAENIRASTFDSLCLNIVLNSPDSVNEFFGIRESLSRSAKLVENETLNYEYFREFYARFINDHGDRYLRNGKNIPAMVNNEAKMLYKLVCKLMSKGIMPLEFDWFGDGERTVKGDLKETERLLNDNAEKCTKELRYMYDEPYDYVLPDTVPEISEAVHDTAYEDRDLLLYFIHDIYYEFIKKSISDNRLTFGLVELFAFAVLYSDPTSRRMNSVDYMMVDEFQDTNELQMKICLLLLKRPNLCVVGDWKQGIYGFRFVSTENITRFEERSSSFIDQLNVEEEKIPFQPQKAERIELKKNYRSSKLVLEKAFESLYIKGTEDEDVVVDNIVKLDSENDPVYGSDTAFESYISDDREHEIRDVVRKIVDYRRNPKYVIWETDGKVSDKRNVRFGDIAVLCRDAKYCRMVLEECERHNIPAFFQGEVEVMSTREGKLALAWLRYVNNSRDRRGISTILTDMGYPLSEIKKMADDTSRIPDDVMRQREFLDKKRRRPNDLMTSIFEYYGIDNDISQTIINTLSSAYSNSLLTISDLIRLMEDDIENGTKYDVETSLDSEAVTIQTIHKSKGLEYPIVIVAGVDRRTFPNTKGEKDSLRFSELFGIRCTKEYILNDDREAVLSSWRYRLLKKCSPPDYSEERRLLFVALSRAKQYISMFAFEPTNFFSHYGEPSSVTEDSYGDDEVMESVPLTEMPSIGSYRSRRRSLTPHDLMELYDGYIDEESEGKGAEFGTKIHNNAYLMCRNLPYDDSEEEMKEVRRILDSLSDAELTPEVGCVLPVKSTSIRGTIDLLAVFDDRIEIHDYKTDQTQRFLQPYMLQLSIYARAAEMHYGKKAECVIDFVSQKRSVRFEPMSMDEIQTRIEEYYRRTSL